MSLTRKTLCAFLAVFAAALWMPTTGRADCTAEAVSQVKPPDISGPPGTVEPIVTIGPLPLLNQEGLTERPFDLLIWDAGTGQVCFPAGRQIIVTYNAALTVAGSSQGSPPAVPSNLADMLDVVDSKGASGLVVSVGIAVGLSTFDTPQTVITITVLQAGTPGNALTSPNGAWIRLKNLRFDVTSLATKAGGTVLSATLSATAGSEPPLAAALFNAGRVEPTICTGGDCQTFIDFVGLGFQNTPPDLCEQQAELEFGEGFAHSFRTAITSQGVFRDIPTGDTSLIFDVTSIPAGVTVTFPSVLANSVSGNGALVFTARSSTLTATGGSLAVIYDTTTSGAGTSELEVQTAGSASSTPTADFDDPPDAFDSSIGVAVGSTTGFGTANILVAFGPTPTGAFTGDDVQAAGIPRYIQSVAAPVPTRRILSGAFFTIQPTQTVLLYPYMTDVFGFQTGIEIANTGNTTATSPSTLNAFKTTPSCSAAQPQTGTLTFFFFPNGSAAPFWFTASSAIGRGLTSGGQLAPGNIFADSLDDLLKQAGQPGLVGKFDGYLIVVAQFNFGHGLGIVFNSSGATSNESALVLGPFDSERAGFKVRPEGLKQ